MNRLATTVAAALVSVAFSSGALAQDKPTAPANSPNAGKRIQSPDKGSVQNQEPAPENMDANSQRQHSRSTPAAGGSQSANQGGQRQQAQTGEVRNWSKIDTNKDGLISPDEMEKDLQQGKRKQ